MKHKILLIDNYDSFTYNLAQYFWGLGFDTTVFRNDQISLTEVKAFDPSHIIISPGPGTPDDSGISMELIREFHQIKPILGVCLGHQCIGQFFGGLVKRAPIPKHGKASLVKNKGMGVFQNLPAEFKAIRYHSLIVAEDTINQEELEITARSEDDDLVMALQHKKYKVHGIQFHPESIMTEYGHQMLKNFVELTG